MSSLQVHASRIILLLCCLVVVGAGRAGGEMIERLVFADAVCVEGPDVRLGNLAVAHGPESTVFLEHFAQLKVADAPDRQGGKMIVSAEMVRRALERVAMAPGSLDIPYQIQVQRGGHVITGKEIRRKVDNFLTKAFSSMQAEVTIREYRLPDSLFVPDIGDTLAITSSRTIEPGRVSFRINVVDEKENIVRRISASAFVDVWVTVPCAARPLRRGSVIVPTVVRFERKNLAYLRGGVWNGRGGPWRVIRPMGTGEVVYDKNIELLPTISRGARISLIFEGPTIRLEVPAEALEDGRVGKSIMVRNLQSNKQVLARVRDKDTVVVH